MRLKIDKQFFKKVIRLNYRILFIILRNIWFSDQVSSLIYSDKLFIKILYFLSTHQKLNLDNPKTFNEKLQWLKINKNYDKYANLVDKYEVRDFVKKTVGEKYLIPLLGVWNKFEEIEWDSLPNEFVIKATHDCGSVIICNNKSNLDLKLVEKKLNYSLNRNYFLKDRAPVYKNLKPRLIAEKFIKDDETIVPNDFKFFCFNGKVEFIQVDSNRFSKHKRNIYNSNWDFIDLSLGYPNDKYNLDSKPSNLLEMIRVAEDLSRGINHVRVDLYNVNNNIILFGEMTFFHGSGIENFIPKIWNRKFGDLIKI